MCPKLSRKRKKQTILDKTSDKSKPATKKQTKGEIKHEKKLLKKKQRCESAGKVDNVIRVIKNEKTAKKSINLHDNDSDSSLPPTQNSTDSSNEDLSTDVNSAFVKAILQKSGIKIAENKQPILLNKKIRYTNEDLQNDVLDGFTTIKKGKCRQDDMNKAHEKIGYEAYRLMTNGKRDQAGCLNKAIRLNSNDLRHYFNRSYSHMINGEYIESLNDIQQVLNNTDDPLLIAKMKFRQGQIHKLIKQYRKAEECFVDCLGLYPHSATVRCELSRIRIERLLSMGFPEHCVIGLHHDHSRIDIETSVRILGELGRSGVNQDEESYELSDDDEIYQSDSEEDPSNTQLFMKTISFDVYAKDDIWYRDSDDKKKIGLPSIFKTMTDNNSEDSPRKENKTIKELKVTNTRANKSAIRSRGINTKAVWVGSLTDDITDSAIKRVFSHFGPVESIYRSPTSNCGFVNFKNEESAEVAIFAENVEVKGKILPIKLNKRH